MSAQPKNKKDIIEQVVNLLGQHPQIQHLFKRFHVDMSYLPKIEIDFKKMDVSAKTRDGKIYLNPKFMEDGDIVEDLHYIVHELVHVLQQVTGTADDYGDLRNYNYLDMPTEIEAFREQLRFIESYKGSAAADDYLDQLLKFHEYSGDAGQAKAQQLRG